MSRKTNIRVALAAIVLGVVVWAFWPGRDEEAMSVTYAGVSTNGSNLVLFTITNRSKAALNCRLWTVERKSGKWSNFEGPIENVTGSFASRSGMTLEWMVTSTNRWKVYLVYAKPHSTSFIMRTRIALGQRAFNLGWERICLWILPEAKGRYTYGPEMLGNQPAPAVPP